MNLNALVRVFDEAFHIEVPGVAGGKAFQAERPVELPAALEAISRTEEDRTAVEEDWPNALGKDAIKTVLEFEWDGAPGSSASIDLLALGGDRAYVGWNAEWQYYVIAALDSLDAFPELFVRLLADNGALCGTELFGSLPTRTINSMPEALPKAAVTEGYQQWARWAALNGISPCPMEEIPDLCTGPSSAHFREVIDTFFIRGYHETGAPRSSPSGGE